MEVVGYEDTKFLFMGMSTWRPNVQGTNWASTAMGANELGNPETTNNNGDLVINDPPAPTGTVAQEIAAVAAAGFKGISYGTIKDNLDEYFVLNHYGVADYEGTGTAGVPGHIPGAFQFNPRASLGADQMLPNPPTDKPIVVYCWTGQHSAQVAAYLNMLGYDAYSLVYGGNNLFHASLTASFKKWDPSFVQDFALEVTGGKLSSGGLDNDLGRAFGPPFSCQIQSITGQSFCGGYQNPRCKLNSFPAC